MDKHHARALVLLDHEQNRRLLCDRLRSYGMKIYEQIEAGKIPYDICLFDGLALIRHHAEILQLKRAAEPVYLPCLLIGRHEHNPAIFREYYANIDQVLNTPLSDTDLRIQIDIALRARRHSVSLQAGLAEAAARATILQERYRIVSELTSDFAYGLYRTENGSYRFEWITTAFETVTGYTIDELNRLGCKVLVHPEDIAQLRQRRLRLKSGMTDVREMRLVTKSGDIRWVLDHAMPQVDDGEVPRVYGAAQDITEKKRYASELEYQATHDALTGLPNRTLLRDRLEQALNRAQREPAIVAVLFVDLDHFKLVNDTLGHDFGDRLLCETARRLTSTVRDGDTVARQGGDDFVVVIEGITGDQQVIDAADRVLHALSVPFVIDEREFFLSCSIGIGMYPKDGVRAADLLKSADAAMYQAKSAGRNMFRFYAGEMNALMHLRFELEAALRHAVTRNEFVLDYQPQVDIRTGKLIGFEALVRWNHPALGRLGPSRFIGLAEETGVIVQIGEWVLREACRQSRQWLDATHGDYFVAVNLSARQFRDGKLVQLVDSALRDAKLDASHLELEITESLLMENPETAADTLHKLRERGVRLSIDDFGTGYSSLGYLKRFPLDKLKIDYSFVRDITSDPDSAAIATAIIAMAHRLNLRVIAEGVETEGQFDYLRAHRCDEVQGFFFSKPLPADECTRLLQMRRVFDLPALDAADQQTILLVDDEENILKALRRVLRRDGYRIFCAGSAREGFEILAKERIDIVVSDQRMPGMSGTEFLSRVRELHPDTVRLVLSGYTDLDSVTEAINRGAIYKFLTKPWEDDNLRAHIAEAFKWRQMRQA